MVTAVTSAVGDVPPRKQWGGNSGGGGSEAVNKSICFDYLRNGKCGNASCGRRHVSAADVDDKDLEAVKKTSPKLAEVVEAARGEKSEKK